MGLRTVRVVKTKGVGPNESPECWLTGLLDAVLLPPMEAEVGHLFRQQLGQSSIRSHEFSQVGTFKGTSIHPRNVALSC